MSDHTAYSAYGGYCPSCATHLRAVLALPIGLNLIPGPIVTVVCRCTSPHTDVELAYVGKAVRRD